MLALILALLEVSYTTPLAGILSVQVLLFKSVKSIDHDSADELSCGVFSLGKGVSPGSSNLKEAEVPSCALKVFKLTAFESGVRSSLCLFAEREALSASMGSFLSKTKTF
jgi:hypothetical protein